MKNYLFFINEKLNHQKFNEWYIDDLFYSFFQNYNEKEEQIASIFYKYSKILYDYKKINLSKEEADIIYKNYSNDYNVLLRVILNFFLSNSYLWYKSTLTKDCIEYSNIFFQSNDKIIGGKPTYNLFTILKWTIYKHPNEKQNICQNIYSKIINVDVYKKVYFSIVVRFLKEKDLNNLFNEKQYLNVLTKYFKYDVNANDVKFYIDSYNIFLEYLFEKNKEEYKKFLKCYCDFIFHNLKNIDFYTKQTELQKVRRYMDLLKEYNDDDYKIIDDELEIVNRETLTTLKPFSVTLPMEQIQKLDKAIEKSIMQYKKLSNPDKIWRLLAETLPLSIENLKETYDKTKKGMRGIFGERILDQDGRVINFNKLSIEDDFSLKSYENIRIDVNLYFEVIFKPFYDVFKMDEEAKTCIINTITNNQLVDSSRIQIISEKFITFFEGRYQDSAYNIVIELEESIRYYLKKSGLNIIKRDGSGDYIDLNYIFNKYKNNSFRDELLKIIDEDYYFTFEWFLTDGYGANIRNKISHSIKSVNLDKTQFAIFIVVHIFRFYCAFQNK